MKRIVICSDGTWNKPERELKKDTPTNVLKLARAVRPMDDNGTVQTVFYDWGVGSYYDPVGGGVTGSGLQKNIEDCYRFIVHNYEPGDQLFFFGFSRGAYTVRALSGLINNCGILKKQYANLIIQAIKHYKNTTARFKPSSPLSQQFRRDHAHDSREVAFIGVWDTVGAMGIPLSIAELFSTKEDFHDRVIGKNAIKARHALGIDEIRADFEPTIWKPNGHTDLEQVWFCGVHSDIGGGYLPDENGELTALFPLGWIADEAALAGLTLENHWIIQQANTALPPINKSYKAQYRLRGKYFRPIHHNCGDTILHGSVVQRWQHDQSYRPKNLVEYANSHVWP